MLLSRNSFLVDIVCLALEFTFVIFDFSLMRWGDCVVNLVGRVVTLV